MNKLNNLNDLALHYQQYKDEKSFNKIYKEMNRYLKDFIYMKYFNIRREILNDCIADTFYAIVKSIDQYNPNFSFKTWCWSIANNYVKGYIRNNSRISHLNEFTTSNLLNEEIEPSLLTSMEEQINKLLSTKKGYNNAEKRVLMYNIVWDKFVNDMDYESISKKYKVNVNSAKTYVSNAKKILRELNEV